MKTIRQKIKFVPGITAVMFSIVFLLDAAAGDLEPPAAPAKTMKTLDEVEARIPIPASAAPVGVFTINQPGSYYLTGDRNCSETAISVSVDKVTIDLNGYQLVGSGSGGYYGIFMDGRSNVEIRNGTISNFSWNGMRELSGNSRGHRIINVRVLSNGHSGSYTGMFLSGRNHLVKDCTATGNTYSGIYAGVGSTFTGNTCYENGGRGIHGAGGSTITGNNCYDNSIGIYAGSGCTIIGNTARSNTNSGITVGNYCFIDQNTATDNTPNLIFGTGCKGVNVAP